MHTLSMIFFNSLGPQQHRSDDHGRWWQNSTWKVRISWWLLQVIQPMVNWWFGFLGSPHETDCYLAVLVESQTTNPNHQLATSWKLVVEPPIWNLCSSNRTISSGIGVNIKSLCKLFSLVSFSAASVCLSGNFAWNKSVGNHGVLSPQSYYTFQFGILFPVTTSYPI